MKPNFRIIPAQQFFGEFSTVGTCYKNARDAAETVIRAAPEKFKAHDAVTLDKLTNHYFTGLALAEAKQSTVAVGDIFAMARDGKPLFLDEFTEDGLRTQTGQVARELDVCSRSRASSNVLVTLRPPRPLPRRLWRGSPKARRSPSVTTMSSCPALNLSSASRRWSWPV